MSIKVESLIIVIFLIAKAALSQPQFTYSTNNKEFVYKTLFSYELKNISEDGVYFVIKEQECGRIDTIIIGEVKNFKRDGKWFYYEDEDILPCVFKPELTHIKTYKDGILLSVRDLAMTDIETFYVGTSDYEEQFWKKKIYRNQADKILIDSMVGENMLRREFSLSGSLMSKILFKDQFYEIIEYHKNGLKSTEYTIIDILRNGKHTQVIDGEFKKWDENGQLIELSSYHEGLITKSTKLK